MGFLKKKYEDDVVVRGVLYSVMVLYHFNGEWLTHRGNRTEISRNGLSSQEMWE